MSEIKQKSQQERYYLLDAVRGLCILGMIVYHTLFDLVAFYNFSVSPMFINIINIIRDFGASCFIFLSGICIHFGHKPLKRALFISAAGLVITGVTYIFAKDVCVIFGILTFMGLAGLIICPLKNIFNKIPPAAGLIVSFILFLLSFEVKNGYIGYYGIKLFLLPAHFYKNYFTALLGFPFPGFSSGDYFPLLPWIFMFFSGFFFWNIVKNNDNFINILRFRIKFLEKTGKYSLYIYILHQPVILLLVELSGWIFNHFN